MKELPKPKRQPDYIDHRSNPYWFDEMVCIVDVSFPMATSRRVCELGTHDHGHLISTEVYIKFPKDSREGGHVGVHLLVREAYDQWKKRRAEELLLSVET